MCPFSKGFHGASFMQLHGIFGVLLTLGIIFFAFWAIKNLSKDRLKKLWVWFIVIGFVGSVLLSGGMKHGKFGKYGKRGFDKAEKSQIMQEVFKSHGCNLSDEEFEQVWEEVKEQKKTMKKEKMRK